MSKRAKYRAKRQSWLEAYASGILPFQVAERMNDVADKALDMEHCAALREQGLIDEPYPEKPVEWAHKGAGTSPGDRTSYRCITDES